MSVPGLKVVAPSTPADAYGLMKAALQEEGPVVYVDHKRLFPTAGEVPAIEEATPIGKAVIRRRGTDVTVVTHSYTTRVAAEAADLLAAEGISCELVDLRTLAPLDIVTICESAARTGALLTLEEGQTTCGVGTEVAFRVRERVGQLRVARVGALPAPVSSNPVFEAACLPDVESVARSIRRLLKS
jgi:pyruvate/2-oxoglutarate/acetoin dehydrogenase E1 component